MPHALLADRIYDDPRPDVVLHAFNLNILEEVGGFAEFEASFDYIASSRVVRRTHSETLS